jgi:hypothetical protein
MNDLTAGRRSIITNSGGSAAPSFSKPAQSGLGRKARKGKVKNMAGSILDRVKLNITNPEGGGYKSLTASAVGEIIGDLRERNKELRETLGMARAQIELAQTEGRRANDRMDKLEVLLGRCQRQLHAYEQKLTALGVNPESLLIEDQRHADAPDPDKNGTKGE